MYTLKEIRKILNIQEQDRNEDSWSDGDAVDAYEGDGKPFKPFEVAILKLIHQNLTKGNMEDVLRDHAYPGEPGRKWQNIAKLIGLSHNVQKGHSMEDIAYDKRYVKWALDNWTEDGDYASIEKPIKVPPKRYEVSREESGTQVEYKEGTVNVVAYDEANAADTADSEFWDWGGDMETTDYGDYESFDSEITNVDPIELLSEEKQKKFNKLVKLCQLGEKYTPKMVGGVTKHTLVKFLKESLNEGKQVGTLYHYTSKDGLKGILKSNSIKASEEYYLGEEIYYISFTRNKNFHKKGMKFNVKTDYRITLDGDKLSNRYKIQPFAYIPGWSYENSWEYEWLEDEDEQTRRDFFNATGDYDEQEERIYFKDEEGEIPNIKTYIISIDKISESKENLNDMVYIDEPKKKHIKKMNASLGPLEGFPIDKFKNMPPPENESTETEEEIDYLDSIPVEKGFVNSADDIDGHFKKFLKSKGLEFPGEELKEVLKGVKSIILQLKYHYNRPRPNQIADVKNLKLDSEHLKSSGTPSYPSGHATQGTFIGRYLADLYPEYEKELRQIGEDIAFSRNMAKVHYPSDSEFGKMLGNDLYEFLYQPEEELSEQISPEALQDLYAFHGEELNERKFGEKLKDFTHKKKEDLKKFWFELTKVAKRERKETAEAVKILARLIKNRSSVTKEDITFLKQQSGDIARIITLISLGAVSVVIPVGLEKLLNQYGISIMPKQRGKDEDGNEIDDHIDATQDDNLLNEQKEINPELKVGDLIKVLDVGDKAPISPELFTNYVVDKIGEGGWRVEGTMRGVNKWYDLLPENWEDELSWRVELNGKMFTSAEDEDITKSTISRILRDGDTWIKVNPTETLNESKQELNPELKQGDFIRIYNVDKDPPIISREGYTDQDRYMMYGSDSVPQIFKVYVVMMATTHKRMGREGEKNEKIYVLLGPDMNTSRLVYLIPTHDTWVKLSREEGMEEFKNELESYNRMNLNESTETNQPLKRGDEVMIVDLDHNTQGYVTGRSPNSLVTPKTFTPYRIFGIIHRQRENWEGPDTDTRIYQLEPIDITDEQRFRDSISGGGRRRGLHMIPGDTWILQKRPENWYDNLHEQQFPFNPNNKDMERDYPEGEPDWSIRRGNQHYAMNVENTPNEPVAAFNNYLVKNSPFIIEGFDFYLSAVPGNMPQSAIVDVYVPMMDDSALADDIWNNDRIYYKINADNWYSADARDGSKYEEIKEKLHNLDFNQKIGEFTYYDDFQDRYPEYIEYLKKELGDTNLLNEPGAQYQMIWKTKRMNLQRVLDSMGKLFGVGGVMINRDPRKPWKRQKDSYGNEKIRPGKLVPRRWPRS
jgi:hypothetical protein